MQLYSDSLVQHNSMTHASLIYSTLENCATYLGLLKHSIAIYPRLSSVNTLTTTTKTYTSIVLHTRLL